MAPPELSIIMPVLNEAAGIDTTLAALLPLRQRGAELVVVDGGSTDDTALRAAAHGACVLTSVPGRAAQMNAGARRAAGSVLLFLHADTVLPADADRLINSALSASSNRRVWGRFDVSITGRSGMLPVIAAMMNWRSRLTGIATGDQALFMTRAAFAAAGGFAAQPLMEDIDMSRRLRKLSPPACLRERVATSGRRWESRGVWRTVWLMWRLRFAYWRGVSPDRLARRYR
ncbi:MAG: glycosyl transferase [Polaromonas sp.]|jgi:rSAM/selenodomain-associated transferase 2|nr:glycosyl transferase [Polaromonas sp.]